MSDRPNLPPLARSQTKDVLDWDHLEPRAAPASKDVLGLSPADRSALGLSAPRTMDTVPQLGGDASAALAEILARGGAMRKTEKKAGKKADAPR